jgi:hypothetical protein
MTRRQATQGAEIAQRNDAKGAAAVTAAGRVPPGRPTSLAEVMLYRAAARQVWPCDLFGW